MAAVSYLNTKPLLYGIRQHEVLKKIELVEDYPAKIADQLIDGSVDVGLVPVAIIPRLPEWHLVTDYCIGSEGAVASVCIFSEAPMAEIETVYLDYQSRTSVALARLLLRDYWKKDVRFIDATGEDFRNKICGTTAAVVIGDRALELSAVSTYIYDLGEAWTAHTGLPFVFAAWVANKALPSDFITAFNNANAQGVAQIDAVAAELHFNAFNLHDYFKKFISYKLTAQKQAGLGTFLEKLR